MCFFSPITTYFLIDEHLKHVANEVKIVQGLEREIFDLNNEVYRCVENFN